MATIKPIYGSQLLIMIGDGADPEVYTHPALINTSRGIEFSTAVETDELIDVADQSAPAVTVRRVRSSDSKIDGAGVIHEDDLPEYLAWAAGSDSGKVRNVEVRIGGTSNVIRGKYVLTSFKVSGDRAKMLEVQITLEQADKPTVVTTP